jgi:5'-3' exonuclease
MDNMHVPHPYPHQHIGDIPQKMMRLYVVPYGYFHDITDADKIVVPNKGDVVSFKNPQSFSELEKVLDLNNKNSSSFMVDNITHEHHDQGLVIWVFLVEINNSI